MISNILHYRLPWPEPEDSSLSSEAIRAIKGLLSYDPTLRFQLNGTSSRENAALVPSDGIHLDLKSEPFFQAIDWDNLANHPAPFIPVPDNDSDTFYFEGKERRWWSPTDRLFF